VVSLRETKQEVLPSAGGTPPHNQRIEPTARGGHAFCEVLSVKASLRAKVAPVPSGPSASQAALRPCSRLIRALYGRCTGRSQWPQLEREPRIRVEDRERSDPGAKRIRASGSLLWSASCFAPQPQWRPYNLRIQQTRQLIRTLYGPCNGRLFIPGFSK